MKAQLIRNSSEIVITKGHIVALCRSFDGHLIAMPEVKNITDTCITVPYGNGKGFYRFEKTASADGYFWGQGGASSGFKIRPIKEGDAETLAAQKSKAEAEQLARMEESFRKQQAAKEAKEARLAEAWSANIDNWTNRQLVQTANGQIHIVRLDRNPAYGERFETVILRFTQVEDFKGKTGYRMSAAYLDGTNFSCSSVFDVCETKVECFKDLLYKWW